MRNRKNGFGKLFVVFGIIALGAGAAFYYVNSQGIHDYRINAAKRSGKEQNNSSYSLSVNLNPVAVGSQYTISGSGFAPGSVVYFSYSEPFCCGATTLTADSNGEVGYVRKAGSPGAYTVNAYQYDRNKLVFRTKVSFDVN